MKTAKPGDMVTVVYDGILENGDLFESSQDTGPLEFQIGAGNVFAAFEAAVIGMDVNESKEILMQPEEAYGLHKEELVHTVPRSSWAANADIQPGVVVGMTMEKDGRQHQVPAMVKAVSGDMVTIDFNHPLAGSTVLYRITLQKITPSETLPTSGNFPFPDSGSPS